MKPIQYFFKNPLTSYYFNLQIIYYLENKGKSTMILKTTSASVFFCLNFFTN